MQVKQLVSMARFYEALALGEQRLVEVTGKEKQLLLQSCFVSARNLGDYVLTKKYYEQFQTHLVARQTFEEELSYLHVEIIYQLMVHDIEKATKKIKQFQALTADLQQQPVVAYTAGAILYYQILYFYEVGEYVNAIKLYNDIHPNMMAQISEENPALYLHIHSYLASAYIHLSKWRTAEQLLRELETLELSITKPQLGAKCALMQQFLNYALYRTPIEFAQCETLFEACQPFERLTYNCLMKDMHYMLTQKPNDAMQQLYEQWCHTTC